MVFEIMSEKRPDGNSAEVERVLYAKATYDEAEEEAVKNVLKNEEKLVGGDYTERFQDEVSTLFGKRFGVMTNSGSSANMLAIESLPLSKGAEIITPITTFSTTVAPVVQNGLVPVFIDIELGTYQIQADNIEDAITEKTEAIFVPALVGNLPDWPRLQEIANNHHLYLIEDSADTIGATIDGGPTGAFTDVSTTSFYGSHVITAFGGGGMVCFDELEFTEKAKKLRAWGRKSAVDEDITIRERLEARLDDTNYDSKFVFDEIGYNFLPLEASAAFGLQQLEKLDDFIETRRHNFSSHTEFFEKYRHWFILPEEREDARTCWLAYPLTVTQNAPFERNEIVEHLEQNGVQTRSLWSGNILRHPGFENIDCRIPFEITNADEVLKRSFVIGCHQSMTPAQCKYIYNTLEDFFNEVE